MSVTTPSAADDGLTVTPVAATDFVMFDGIAADDGLTVTATVALFVVPPAVAAGVGETEVSVAPTDFVMP